MEANIKEELKGEANFYGLGDLMFPVAPFTPAQPKTVTTEWGNGVTISQDIQGMWFMTSEPEYGHVVTPIIYCRNCRIGFLNDPKYGVHLITIGRRSIKAFSAGREILPNQPKCSVNTSCPNGCSFK
jgi:hypothetical protein